MMSEYRLKVLGEAQLEGDKVLRLERKSAGVLAYVALEGPTTRALLAGLLWPNTDEAQARTNLRKVMTRLRNLEGLLQSQDPVTLSNAVWVDVQQPEHDMAAPELLAGLDYSDCPEFFEWLLLWRERLREQRVQRLEETAEELLGQGDLETALTQAKSLLHLEPHSEAAYRRVMRLHYLLGDRGAALQTYHRCQEVLRREFGLEPVPQTQELAKQIERSSLSIPEFPRRKAIPLPVLRPPLVGREEVWARLEAAWDKGQIVLLAGEAGLGKTRLVQEFVTTKGAALVMAARPGDQGIPYASMARTLRTAWREGKLNGLEEWVRLELSRILPELMASPTEIPQHTPRLYQACAVALGAAAQGAAAIVADDLHNFDQGSFQIAHHLAGRLSEGLRLVVGFRPSELPEGYLEPLNKLIEAGLAVRIDLEPLSQGAVQSVADQLELPLGAEVLYRHTGGNPLFVVETLKSCYEAGEFATLGVPDRVGSLIAQRLERLSKAARRLIWAIALSGGEVDLELIATMLETPVLDLSAALAELEAAQMLRNNALSHDLIAETARATIPGPIKTLLHKRAALHLEGLRQSTRAAQHMKGSELNARAAQHWLEAGDAEQAVRAWEKAAEDMYRRGLPHEAVRLLERAHEHARGEGALEVQVRLANMYIEIARYDQARTLVEAVLPQAQDPWLRASALRAKADLLRLEGELNEALKVVEEATRLVAYLEDQTLKDDLFNHRVEIAWLQGRYPDALELSKAELERLRDGGTQAELAMVLSNIGVLYRHLGQAEAGIPYHLEARAIARKIGAKQQEFQSANNLARTYQNLGQTEQALSLTTEALSLGNFNGRDTVRGNQAALFMRMGRLEEAIAVSQALTHEADELQERIKSWARLAELYTLTHQHQRVRGALEQAIALAQTTPQITPKVKVIINVLKFGSSSQQEEVRGWLETIDFGALPPDMREELEALQQKDRDKG